MNNWFGIGVLFLYNVTSTLITKCIISITMTRSHRENPNISFFFVIKGHIYEMLNIICSRRRSTGKSVIISFEDKACLGLGSDVGVRNFKKGVIFVVSDADRQVPSTTPFQLARSASNTIIIQVYQRKD